MPVKRQSKGIGTFLNLTYSVLVSRHSGRTSVFGRRTFDVLRDTYSWRVTTYVGKLSAIG